MFDANYNYQPCLKMVPIIILLLLLQQTHPRTTTTQNRLDYNSAPAHPAISHSTNPCQHTDTHGWGSVRTTSKPGRVRAGLVAAAAAVCARGIMQEERVCAAAGCDFSHWPF